MKYKVGDKVRVKSKEWYDENKGEDGVVAVNKFFVKKMAEWCGKEVIIDKIFDDFYRIKDDEDEWNWSDEMFEDENVKQTEKRKFKCKDEVIVRLKKPGCCWFYGVVSHSGDDYVTLSGGFRHPYEIYDVLPYEGNEHMVGTLNEVNTDEVLLEIGELLCGFWGIDDLGTYNIGMGKFIQVMGDEIETENASYMYCIPFSKFNPDDLEATKKEILMVKDGKLVKAW